MNDDGQKFKVPLCQNENDIKHNTKIISLKKTKNTIENENKIKNPFSKKFNKILNNSVNKNKELNNNKKVTSQFSNIKTAYKAGSAMEVRSRRKNNLKKTTDNCNTYDKKSCSINNDFEDDNGSYQRLDDIQAIK
ncbi:Hypothetical protein SRAE_2000405900 [Strongyloides ratti]|uniref:Uncharacterized protein n=1 Tax=Strongyloides ratti TaxID=34506 RepID=A0A090LPE8_STRRB|nr:Hypothetical protein SRAE_2000405900 [Strongyloides ratti]CEF69410.1 Hypothetical protein SRAE_2000405900 [Strongyloides ratti]